ncbi:HlyD family efflux transporter periplasmic adaptor subunit [Shewanella sp. NIFS-20-20]|nr:HlyD family efflux transporter periplasmic adaptor subunit [Shewanella sp. NIFS-20-20]
MLICLLGLQACSPKPTAEVTQGQLQQVISVTGELKAANSSDLMPPAIRRMWQYQISHLENEGQFVNTGDVVAQIDSSELSQRLSVKMAELEATRQDVTTSTLRNEKRLQELTLSLAEAKMNAEKADLKFAIADDTVAAIDKQKYRRDAEIAHDKVKLVTQQIELERQGAIQRQAMLQNDLQTFQLEVDELKRAIAALTLTAPRSGMLMHGTDHEGNKIKAGQSVFVGDTVVSIVDLTQLQVTMTIPEVEARRIYVGQKVALQLDANPEREFTGALVALGSVFRNKRSDVPLVVFDAKASIDNIDAELMRPGMTVKIRLDDSSDAKHVLLPISAVFYQEGQAFVKVPTWYGQQDKPVIIGKMGEQFVEIISGLVPGEKVML